MAHSPASSEESSEVQYCVLVKSGLLQGFFTSVDRETLKCWRMTAADLAELAAGPQGAAGPQTRRPTAQSLKAAGQLSQKAAQHIATSNEPVVNTLWKVILLMLPNVLRHKWAVNSKCGGVRSCVK